MSIMSDARLRLLEARVAEVERRLGDGTNAPNRAAIETCASQPKLVHAPSKAKSTSRKPSRKTP